MTDVRMLPVAQLDVAASNVRKAGVTDGLDQLVASIKAYGVLMPLLVTPSVDEGRFVVIDGQRRFLAAKKAGLVEVPCTVTVGGAPEQLSLTANVTQMPMRPGDQYRAFAACLYDTKPAEIAKRFGVTKKFVEQRLKLADLAPEVLDRLDEGRIGIELAEALTTTSRDFQTEQWLPAFEKRDYWATSASSLRRALTNVRISVKHALFDVKKAELEVVRDLFDKDDGGYVTDTATFLDLQMKALESVAEGMRAEWGSVVVVPQSQFSWDKYRYASKDDPKTSGVVLVLAPTGEVVTRRGYVPAETAAKTDAKTPAETRAETRKDPTHLTSGQDAEITQRVRDALKEMLVAEGHETLKVCMAIAIGELSRVYDGPRLDHTLALPTADIVARFQQAVAERITAQANMPWWYGTALAALGSGIGEVWQPSPDWVKAYTKDQIVHFLKLYDPAPDQINADAKRDVLAHRLLTVLPEGWVPPKFVPPAEGESPFAEEDEAEMAEAA